MLGPAVRDVLGSEGAKVRKEDKQTHFLLLVFFFSSGAQCAHSSLAVVTF